MADKKSGIKFTLRDFGILFRSIIEMHQKSIFFLVILNLLLAFWASVLLGRPGDVHAGLGKVKGTTIASQDAKLDCTVRGKLDLLQDEKKLSQVATQILVAEKNTKTLSFPLAAALSNSLAFKDYSRVAELVSQIQCGRGLGL